MHFWRVIGWWGALHLGFWKVGILSRFCLNWPDPLGQSCSWMVEWVALVSSKHYKSLHSARPNIITHLEIRCLGCRDKDHVCLLQLRKLVRDIYFQPTQTNKPIWAITLTAVIEYRKYDGLITGTLFYLPGLIPESLQIMTMLTNSLSKSFKPPPTFSSCIFERSHILH